MGREVTSRQTPRSEQASIGDVDRDPIQDTAFKVVGVGSVGTRCLIMHVNRIYRKSATRRGLSWRAS